MNEQLIEDMKTGMKNHPYIKQRLDEMMADGLTEDEAMEIMFAAWITKRGIVR